MGLHNTRYTGDTTRGIFLVRPRHFSGSVSPPPSVQPRLTFPHILIWVEDGTLWWIPVFQAEVDQRSHEVELSIPDAGLGGAGWNIEQDSAASQYAYPGGTGQVLTTPHRQDRWHHSDSD